MIKVSDIKALPKYHFLRISACKRNEIKPCPNRPSFSCEIESVCFPTVLYKNFALCKNYFPRSRPNRFIEMVGLSFCVFVCLLKIHLI